MRHGLGLAALAALAACSPGAPAANNAAAPAPAGAANSVSAADLAAAVGTDGMSRAMTCVIHLGVLHGSDAGRQAAMARAAAAWRAQLVREAGAQQAARLIGSHANIVADMPAATREAAAAWCVANAPATL